MYNLNLASPAKSRYLSLVLAKISEVRVGLPFCCKLRNTITIMVPSKSTRLSIFFSVKTTPPPPL